MGYDTAAKRGAKLKRNRALLEKERAGASRAIPP